jgi:putative ABC transport system permease protein
LLERVQSLAGVQHAAIQSQYYIYIQIEDQRNLPEEERWISCMTSSADYFKVVGAVLISGRSFLESENESSPAVVVVNQTFVRKFLHGKNPVGAQIHLAFDPPVSAQIIGVVRDMKQELETDVEPGVYLPYRQQPQQWISVIVRGIFQTPSISKALYEQVWAIDSNQFVYDAYPMSEWLKQSTSERRSIMFLLSFFAIVAIVLAIVGIYSVISYATNRQTHEIGIRMSMGAQKKDVIRMIMKKAALLILIGTTIGLILSFVLNRFLEKLIYGISRNDPVTYISVSVLVIAVAFIASGIPALRAAKVDPVVALREE